MHTTKPLQVHEHLIVEIDDGVATITIDRPQVLNAVDDSMLNAMRRAVELVNERGVGAIVVTGQGRAFSSGASLDGLDLESPPSDATVVALGALVVALQASPAIVVAQVNGAAVGLGFSLVLACDVVVAADSAYLFMAFGAIGLMPDGAATRLLTQAVGRQVALRICLLPERINADEALELGLVSMVVPQADLVRVTRDIASRLAHGPRHAQELTKLAINNQAASLEAAIEVERVGQLALMGSADFREAVTAFHDKRMPVFGHR